MLAKKKDSQIERCLFLSGIS